MLFNFFVLRKFLGNLYIYIERERERERFGHIRHPNLVAMVGLCWLKCMVFEYMHNCRVYGTCNMLTEIALGQKMVLNGGTGSALRPRFGSFTGLNPGPWFMVTLITTWQGSWAGLF